MTTIITINTTAANNVAITSNSSTTTAQEMEEKQGETSTPAQMLVSSLSPPKLKPTARNH